MAKRKRRVWKMTDDQKDAVIDLHNKGYLKKKIAASVNLSPLTVGGIIRTHKVTTKEKVTETESTSKNTIIELLCELRSQKKLSNDIFVKTIALLND